ncbi:BamA/TamA family outer membrane protein [Flavihumibacter profundi]|uniref:hypothetical protein n=1 Tax=Flavihumibacter profundi TaxID=2716883 RepID=UPI001CC40EBE|nr:hypothetical protein [Flavihumibacter profundi]MBZ5855999.1 hypothetical protein [Flavihumibacter profundi]
MMKFASGKRIINLAGFNRLTVLLLLMLPFYYPAFSQEPGTTGKKKLKELIKDTLDNKLDLSEYVIKAHGFVPVMMIITEPALGGFGIAAAPLFISPRKEVPNKKGYIPPDITAGVGLVTANGSWAAGGGRIGSFPKAGIKYRIGAAYADINLDFYRTIANGSEKKYSFNFEMLPVFVSFSKQIPKTDLYAGLQYMFASSIVKPKFSGDLPESITSKEMDANLGSLGMFLDWDKRNSIFTPDKGLRVNLLYTMDDNWTGSDFNYQKMNELVNWFFPIRDNWISGLRFEGHHALQDPPFYLLPSITLRGIPAMRYQGQTTLVAETEQRFDLTRRWSLLGFIGYGKTIVKNDSYIEGSNVYNFGGGFRYLVARAFRARAGIDIAKGPDSWGWYIVFGHNWNR